MSHGRKEMTCIDPELEEYKNKYYQELTDGRFKVWYSEKILKCPYCSNSREYSCSDLIRHATRIVKESESVGIKEKARHMGLIKFLEKDLLAKIKFSESSSDSTTQKQKINDRQIASPKQMVDEELIVWPWMAVVANIPVQFRNGKSFGESGKKLKDEWIKQGYNPIKVHPLWSWQGHSGLAVVAFGKTWDGFGCAMKFVKDFEVNKHGRKDWYNKARAKDDKLYAWISGDEDYNAHGLVGDYLRKNGDLKTVSDIEKEDETISLKLTLGLKTMLEEKSKRSEEIQSEISKTESHIETVMKQKEIMTENFNRGISSLRFYLSSNIIMCIIICILILILP